MKGPLLDLESYKEFVSKKTKSPKQDLIDLAVTINQFLGERILNESQSELTRKQLQVCNFFLDFEWFQFYFDLMIYTF